jgi:hypothetical protein
MFWVEFLLPAFFFNRKRQPRMTGSFLLADVMPLPA